MEREAVAAWDRTCLFVYDQRRARSTLLEKKSGERTCAPTVRDPQSGLSRVMPIVLFALAEKVSLQLAVYNGRAKISLARLLRTSFWERQSIFRRESLDVGVTS